MSAALVLPALALFARRASKARGVEIDPAAGRERPASRIRADRSPVAASAICALLAVIVRVVYLLESAGNPFRRRIGLDMADYDRWARAILEGRGLGEAPFAQAPLFPLLLGATYRLLGPDPVRALWMHLLPAGGAAWLAASAAGNWRGRTAAWCAGLLIVLYKPAIFYTGALLPPAWALFFAALCLWSILRVTSAGAGPPRPSSRSLAGCGLSFGLLALIQPAAALSLVPAAVAVGRAAPQGDRRRSLGFLLAGAVCLPFLTLLYNGAAGGAWAPVAVNGGINLYIGNGPEANGAYIRPPAMREDRDLLGIEAARTLSRPERPEAFGPGEADRFWRGRAIAAATARPARAAGLFLRKLLLFFGQYEVPQVESLPFERRYATLLRLPLPGMALLTGLAVFGAVLLWRERRARWLAASAASVAVGVCVFFVTARFRIPAVPFLAVLGAAGVAEAVARWRAHRSGERRRAWRSPAVAGAIGLAVGVLLSLNLPGLHQRASDGQYHFRLGTILERENRATAAMEEYRRALELDLTLGKAEVNLGTLLAREGRLDEARGHLERGVALDPQSVIGRMNLGQLHQLQGRGAEAEAWYRRALELDPNSTEARRSLIALLRQTGREDEAARLAAGSPTPPSTPARAPR